MDEVRQWHGGEAGGRGGVFTSKDSVSRVFGQDVNSGSSSVQRSCVAMRQNTVMVRNHYMANVFLETKQHKCKMAAARWWASCSARHQTEINTFNACCESYLVTSKI